MNEAVGLVGGVVLIGAAGYLVWKTSRSPSVKSPLQATTGAKAPFSTKLLHGAPRPKNHLPILDAQSLFEKTATTGLIEAIRTRLGLTPANFKEDVMPVLERYAEYVQLLPASESHHHAQPGGLLVHTLEVAANALTVRQGYKLPTGASPEEQIERAMVWSFGVLVAALLHDVGKPVADVVVNFFGDNPAQNLGPWNGLVGSMADQAKTKEATHYAVGFPLTRDYSAHQRLPVALVHVLVPPKAMQWLGNDNRLVQELLAYLDGNEKVATVLKEIISKADSESVAKNLRDGTRIRFAAARNPPLIERLMQGLRTLLSESHLAINRPGAPVFIDPDGQHVWIVAGTAADQVRTLLESREERTEAAAGIPSDNTRLFDTWAEYGALLAPPREFGKGSVWWIKVEIDDWSHVLTMLKFPIATLYPAGATVPARLNGKITPVEPSSRRQAEKDSSQAAGAPADPYAEESDTPDIASAAESTVNAYPASSDVDGGLGALLVQYDSQGGALSSPLSVPIPSASASQAEHRTPSPAKESEPLDADPPPRLPTSSTEFLDAGESAAAVKSASNALSVPKTVQAFKTPNAAPRALYRLPGASTRINAERFMLWIQTGLGNGSLTYNESDAVVHFVAGGMAVVSPIAFRQFLEANEFQGDLGSSPDALRALQKELQKGGYIERNTVNKSSFHMYAIKQSDGNLGKARITTYLIPNPQAYIRPVPSPNPLLQLVNEEPKTVRPPFKPA